MITNIELKEPRGLFTTNNPVGFIYPSFTNKTFAMSRTAVHNNKDGEKIAKDIEKEEHFIKWFINPWTSQINLTSNEEQEFRLALMALFNL